MVLLMGDLNEWRGRSGAIRAFDRRLGPSAAERTFPVLDAGSGARPDLCRWAGGAPRGRRLPHPARPPRFRSPAARRQFVLGWPRGMAARAVSQSRSPVGNRRIDPGKGADSTVLTAPGVCIGRRPGLINRDAAKEKPARPQCPAAQDSDPAAGTRAPYRLFPAGRRAGQIVVRPPDPHGDHFHLGEAVVATRDASGLRNPAVWVALERKGLIRSMYPHGGGRDPARPRLRDRAARDDPPPERPLRADYQQKLQATPTGL